MNLDSVTIPKNRIFEKYVGTKFNDEILVPYLRQYYAETGGDRTIENLIYRVQDCSKLWLVDHYVLSNVAEVKHINFCKCKFCPTCQKILTNNRELKLTPVVDESWEKYDLYHLILTQPNVQDFDLDYTIQKIIKSFTALVRILKCKGNINGLDFKIYGYGGSIRNLEVTFNNCINDYHPHLHCILALSKGLNFYKTNTNIYSYKKDNDGEYSILYQKFSDFEILIQKIWFLLMNDKKVTKKNIDSVGLGCNCVLDLIDDKNYHEIFKYSLKIEFDSMSYENFKTLYIALFRRRTIQGYGIFYNLDIDTTLSDAEVFGYFEIIARLRTLENPVERALKFDYILDELLKRETRFISRKKILLEAENIDIAAPLTKYEIKIKERLIKDYRKRESEKRLLKMDKLKQKHEQLEREKKARLKVSIKPNEYIEDYRAVLDSGFDVDLSIFKEVENLENKLINTTLRKTQLLRRDM